MATSILILTNAIGGLYSFRKEVMQALVDTGHRVIIVAPPSSQYAEYFQGVGCEVADVKIDTRGTNPIADLILLLNYRKLITQYRPTAVLTYTIKPNVYGGLACRLCGVPQFANVTGLGDAVESGGLLQKLTQVLYKVGMKKAKVVFFQNASNMQFCLKKKMVHSRTILLPGSGVNLDWHTVQAYPPENVTKFIFVGRLMVHKGVRELFQMIETIKKEYVDKVEFHICGGCEDEFRQQLDDFVNRQYVIYHGYVIDVREYYKNVHCNIMPSWHEGLSNVNLEASAAGRVVITTDVPGCRETVDDGVTGYLVEVRNAKSLTKAVRNFIELSYEQKRQMGLAARAKVEREFDRNIVINAYLDELKNIS